MDFNVTRTDITRDVTIYIPITLIIYIFLFYFRYSKYVYMALIEDLD